MSDSTQKSNDLSLITNTHATMVFESSKDLQKFTAKTSTRLAALLAVMVESKQIDQWYRDDLLEVANDMAFQVKQAIELMGSDDESEVSNG